MDLIEVEIQSNSFLNWLMNIKENEEISKGHLLKPLFVNNSKIKDF